MRLVFDFDERAGIGCPVEAVGGDQCNRLAGVVDAVVLEREVTLSVWTQMALGLGGRIHARRIATREDR